MFDRQEKRTYSLVYLLFRSILQYIKTSRYWLLLEHGIASLSAFSWFAGILAAQQLFDLISGVGGSDVEFAQIGVSLALFAAITVVQQILRGADQYLKGFVSYKNVGSYMSELLLKLSRVSPQYFEETRFLDAIDRAKLCIEYEELGYFSSDCLRMFTYYGVFFMLMFVYFIHMSAVLPLIILVSFIPALIGQWFQTRVFVKLENECAPLRRQYTYYKNAIASQDTFKETRILGAFNYFRDLFHTALLILNERTWNVEKRVACLRFVLGLVSFLGFGASAMVLFHSTVSGDISIGSFVAFFGILSLMFSMAEELVTVCMSRASEALGKIQSYYELMDWDEINGIESVIDLSKGIRLSNVCFAYPGHEKNAVENVTLAISESETIAIVGENGAGKSTLVRLLIGLYLPDSGQVEIGGINTKTIHPESIYALTSGVFQNYMRYKMTVAENVVMSDMKWGRDDFKVKQCLSASNFSDDSVDLETMLSTEFGGVDLSGGQWQRVAIARGLYRNAKLIVLDEPTAAIDPLEEERIFTQFQHLTKNKCAILVTHRLASAKFAHRIIVMQGGRVVEVGSHDELINRHGAYAEMWNAQSSGYVNKD